VAGEVAGEGEMAKLTARAVEKLIRAAVPGTTGDGQGLYLQIAKNGTASWLFRYQLHGKRRNMGLGPCADVTLAEARNRAADARRLLTVDRDPLAARDEERVAPREAQRLKEARRITFETLAKEYLQAHGGGWSDKWRKGWLRKLELHAFNRIGKLPAYEIGVEQVLRVLQPMWSTKTRTADEVRGQIEQILDAAKVRGLREGENPARWRGNLDNLLSRAEKKKARIREHFPAMRWQDVPALMAKLTICENVRDSAAARLLIFTGARLHMVRFASWEEFDLPAGIWSLSAERMKMRESFDIPLAPEVVALLQSLPRTESPYLFPGQGRARVIHQNAIRNLLHSLGHTDITRHGFRSSFRDWAGDRTTYSRQVCELAIAHDDRDQTEGAYSRSDFLEKRRPLMADWARYCAGTPGEVVQVAFGTRSNPA